MLPGKLHRHVYLEEIRASCLPYEPRDIVIILQIFGACVPVRVSCPVAESARKRSPGVARPPRPKEPRNSSRSR